MLKEAAGMPTEAAIMMRVAGQDGVGGRLKVQRRVYSHISHQIGATFSALFLQTIELTS